MEDNFTPTAFTTNHMHGSYMLELSGGWGEGIFNLTCCCFSSLCLISVTTNNEFFYFVTIHFFLAQMQHSL